VRPTEDGGVPAHPSVAAAQGGVFTLDQALAAGWTPAAVRHALRIGWIRRIRRGVYCRTTTRREFGPHADRRAHAREAAAAWLSTEEATISHRSAAIVADLAVLTIPRRPCLTVAPARHGTRGDVHLHRAIINDRDRAQSRSLHRTGVARTVVDVARECGLDEAVVIADDALHKGMVSPAELIDAVRRQRRCRDVTRAMLAVAASNHLAESALESISRLRISDAGLPTPTLQANLFDARGKWLGRSDFFWEQYGLVGEADGRDKYDEWGVLVAEKERQERFERADLLVVRWGWSDLADLGAFAAMIGRRLEQGGRRLAELGRSRGWRLDG
jgi:hypothetical protein